MSLCLLDTNILLRLVQPVAANHRLVRGAYERLLSRGEHFCYTSQNLAEFWNVCTRPEEQNGFGLSIPGTHLLSSLIETQLTLLPESIETHARWRQLVFEFEVRGTKVHDARLVAAMYVHHVTSLLTLNTADFRRYPGIQALRPEDILNA